SAIGDLRGRRQHFGGCTGRDHPPRRRRHDGLAGRASAARSTTGVQCLCLPGRLSASGISVAQALNMLEHFPVRELGWGSVDNLHLLAETLKVVNSDRRLIGLRPHFETPSKGIASKAFAAE